MYKLLLFTVTVSLCLSLVTCDLNLQEGAACVWNIPEQGEFKGTCVDKHRCFTTLDTRGDQPPVCSTKGDVTIVCCTDCELVNDTRNAIVSPKGGVLWKDGRKFRNHCLDYLNELPNKCPGYYGGIARYLVEGQKCHTHSLWGVGGPPAIGVEPPSVNPYEALLGFGDSVETAVWKTSGAILSDKFILTAGIEAAPKDGPWPKFVAVGVKHGKVTAKKTPTHRVYYRSDAEEAWQTHSVKSLHFHPKYSAHNQYYNVALLELDTPITFTRDVFPACLPDPLAEFDASKAAYTPFYDPMHQGDSFESSRATVEVPLLSAESCAEQLKSMDFSNAFPQGLKQEQVCYGDENSCQMVTGSPVVVNTYLDRCANTVLGIRVFGTTCGPAVFARTQDLLPWIEDTVWP